MKINDYVCDLCNLTMTKADLRIVKIESPAIGEKRFDACANCIPIPLRSRGLVAAIKRFFREKLGWKV